MAYSHSRLRKCLALARILTGLSFLLLGLGKISSVDFAWSGFPQFLATATHGGAVGWYSDALKMISSDYAGKIAVAIAFCELVAGVALLLGLAVRPITILGIIYMFNLMLATWHGVGFRPTFWQQLEGQMRHIFPAIMLFLLAMGHAGETWGLGALYHRRGEVDWRDDRPRYRPGRYDNTDFDDYVPLEHNSAHEI